MTAPDKACERILLPKVLAEQETLPCPGIAGEESVGETFLQRQHSVAHCDDKTA